MQNKNSRKQRNSIDFSMTIFPKPSRAAMDLINLLLKQPKQTTNIPMLKTPTILLLEVISTFIEPFT